MHSGRAGAEHHNITSDALVSGCPQHNPAGLYAMLVESALGYYQYSGDVSAVNLSKDLIDYQLLHGMTPASANWANVPYASSNAGETTYQGAGTVGSTGADGTGVIEPDKTGQFGFAAIKLYEFTGDTKHRDAAIQIANMLASHVRAGDASRSPWPFRVYASDNQIREEYCANAIEPIRLLDELIRLNLGNVASYQAARQSAWTWLMNYPITNNVWANYFEDMAIRSDTSNWNQYNALESARYLIQHPEFDPSWQAHVRGIIAWVENTFGVPQYGANTIKEQIGYTEVTASHTARYASINAMLYDKTGDVAAKDKAYRAFNFATYYADSRGVVIDNLSAQDNWFTDGDGDYIRHFAAGLGAVPEWAPSQENHLLRSSSLVTSIAYQATVIDYSTYDSTSTEVLRLNFVPGNITAGSLALAQRSDLTQPGWTYDPTTGALGIYHTASGAIHVSASTDNIPPTAPGTLTATGSIGFIALSWTASTDNVGVTAYSIHRSQTSGFTPSAANKVGQTTTATSFNDVGLPAGVYSYLVTAQDFAGNVSAPSNEASATSAADTQAPTVSVIAPASGATVSGMVTITATASDNVGVVGVQFLLDGANLGVEGPATPYQVSWNTIQTANGSHTLTARARDAAGNIATSSPVTVTVSNSIAPNLSAGYGMNENSGTSIFDNSGNSNAGTNAGATWTAGKYGNALSFNGSSNFVSINDSTSLDITGPGTIEGWMKLNTLGVWHGFIAKGNLNSDPAHNYAIEIDPSNHAVCTIGNGNSSKSVSSAATLAANTFTHLACTWDGTNLKVYVNGVQSASTAQALTPAANSAQLYLGQYGGSTDRFSGVIDEIRIYKRALSAVEIQTDMNTAMTP